MILFASMGSRSLAKPQIASPAPCRLYESCYELLGSSRILSTSLELGFWDAEDGLWRFSPAQFRIPGGISFLHFEMSFIYAEPCEECVTLFAPKSGSSFKYGGFRHLGYLIWGPYNTDPTI